MRTNRSMQYVYEIPIEKSMQIFSSYLLSLGCFYSKEKMSQMPGCFLRVEHHQLFWALYLYMITNKKYLYD